MKTLFILAILLLGFAAHSQDLGLDPDSTLARIEVDNNAQCDLERVGAKICSNQASWSKHYFICQSPGGVFKVSLRIKERVKRAGINRRRGGMRRGLPCIGNEFTDPVVTKIIYYTN